MMELLETFSALTLVTGLMMTILPEGSLRRTAAMAAGLLLLITWSDGLQKMLQLPEFNAPSAILLPTGTKLTDCASSAIHTVQEAMP